MARTEPLLNAEEPARPRLSVQADAVDDAPAVLLADGATPPPDGDDDVPPYSVAAELRYFFGRGMPLGVSAAAEWGAPPLVGMMFAGHVNESAALQSALGFGRLYFNVSILMVMFGLCSYLFAVIPGCIGAGRKDRIPLYLRRSLLLCTLLLIPSFAMSLVSEPVMRAVSVPPKIATMVGEYTRLMLPNALLVLVDVHLETIFINLGYAKSCSLNSLLTGLGVDIAVTYAFVVRLQWGVRGVALAQLAVRLSRIAGFLALIRWFRLGRDFFGAPRRAAAEHAAAATAAAAAGDAAPAAGRERLCDAAECRLFASLARPGILNNLAGWLIFELQILALANIRGITPPALAAGAVWIQAEQGVAAVQTGWIQVVQIRPLALLGRADPGAGRSYALMCALGTLCVGTVCLAIGFGTPTLSRALSADKDTQAWLRRILWVLIPHSLTRIWALTGNTLFIPLGKPALGVGSLLVSFYLIATPIVAVVALTDLVSTDVALKMRVCVAATTMAQVPVALFGYCYNARLDWARAGKIIQRRANSDKAATPCIGVARTPSGDGRANPFEEGVLGPSSVAETCAEHE